MIWEIAGKSFKNNNLEDLDAKALAELLRETVKGDAARQGRVRMALSYEQNPPEAAADIRMCMTQIRHAKSQISARTQRTLAK